MDKKMRNRLVNKFRDLIDEGYTEFDIKIIDEGFIINPTKYWHDLNKEVKNGI